MIRYCAVTLLLATVVATRLVTAQVRQPGCAAVSGLLIPRDSSFSAVPFTFESPPPAPPLYRNDDGSSDSLHLAFPFLFFGTVYTSVYINNNGNISLGSPAAAYTPCSFPTRGYRMIAPFWADVDTRNVRSGVVYYRSEAHRFIALWDSVGYSSHQADKRNTFEVIITDGTDESIGTGNNVAFSYGDMQWTTGSMSGGSGGFGGIPAIVGINRGDSVRSTVIGRFDHEGTDYDGPGGQPDGVSYLDDRLFTFGISPGWTVYPGDANADGIVDARDILPLGRYFGVTGPPRPGGSLVWGPQEILEPWAPPEACHADCNGDGAINASDVAGIIQNWFRTRQGAGAPHVDRIAVCEELLQEIDRHQPLSREMAEIRNAVVQYMKNELGIVFTFTLQQNWPNPFNPSTTIRFTTPEGVSMASLSIYNLLGQLIWERHFTDLGPGRHEIVWSGQTTAGTEAASNAYIYRVVAGGFTSAKRMLLLK